MGQTVSRLLGSKVEDVATADGGVERQVTLVDRAIPLFRRRLRLQFTIIQSPADEAEPKEQAVDEEEPQSGVVIEEVASMCSEQAGDEE